MEDAIFTVTSAFPLCRLMRPVSGEASNVRLRRNVEAVEVDSKPMKLSSERIKLSAFSRDSP
jgi:hypothetical protein